MAQHQAPMTGGIGIRAARPGDEALVLSFIQQLAEYEKLQHEVVATEATVAAALFGAKPRAYCDLAYAGKEPAGFALWFYNFSTFLAKPGIYLEDLFVRPQFRGRGIGKALLANLAQRAIAQDCGRLEWWVLDWNTPSIEFYKSLGAQPMDEWTVFRVTGDALTKLANT